MCLIIIAYQAHPRYPLIIAGNRDEMYARPTAALEFWPDYPDVLAGRDLELMGTWFGINRDGRLSAVTNFRDGLPPQKKKSSRGHLVRDYLIDDIGPRQYIEKTAPHARDYSGFNLLMGDSQELFYFSNRHPVIQKLNPGVYGLSNHLLNTPWPKVTRAIAGFMVMIEKGEALHKDDLLKILTDQRAVPDEDLPSSGVDLHWERLLAPIFITSPDYGTRSSSVLMIDIEKHVTFFERTWQPAQDKPVAAGEKCHQFPLVNR